ncbi:MAG: RimK family alpha-L-glutamate ligase [Planctomycetota bacterium]
MTCTELPRADPDLGILQSAFARRGVEARIECWEDGAADWSRFDAVVVRSTWNYVARLRDYRAWLERVALQTQLVNPLAAIRWNLHKRYLAELAADGLPVVPTVVVPHSVQPDWAELFARHGDLVLKPAISAGSFATVRVRAGDAAAAHEHRAAHADRDMLVQPLLRSVVERGETNMVYLGGTLSHAIHKGARWDGQEEQSRGLVEATADERAAAEHVLQAVDRRGLGTLAYARVDMARGDDGAPLLMELEIVEPSLFLDRAPGRAELLVDAIVGR